jgi:CheY-like chemotaxis protein
VLIVDDERRNRQLMEVMLGGEGYELGTAESGLQALQMVSQHRPDLILLDVMMPGMNGYEVAASLKVDPLTRTIPIIILTALDDRSSRLHGLSAGAEEFLTKPVNRHELCLRVRNLLKLLEHQQREASGPPRPGQT